MSYSVEHWQTLARCAPATGEEFDWYAFDSKGHLGLFATAGLGPVPPIVWQYRQKMNDLKEILANLPKVGSYERVFISAGSYMEWFDYARKGLFAFDYHDIHRTVLRLHRYELIARPEQPSPAVMILPHTDLHWLPVLDLDFMSCAFVIDSYVK